MLRFKEGDRLDPDILADSERLIRDLSYIEDVRLHVRPDETSQERVNVLIITKDRFSIGVDGSSSGLDRFRMGVYDNNFIGTGIEMGHQLLYEGRYGQPLGYRGSLRLNNLGRSLMTTDVYYTYSEKINEFRVRLDRGFFTPEIKYGGGIDLSRSNRYRQQLASDGIEIELPYTANYYDVWAGRSFLLPGKQVRSNLSFSLRYLGVAFEDRPPVTENDNFFFHKRNFILGTFTFIQRRFFRSRNFSGFGDTEDIPTGFSLALTGGYDNGEFRRRPYASLDLNSGMWLGHAGYLGLHITTAGFLSDRRWEDGLLDFQVLYFSNLLPMKNFRTRQIFQFRYAQGIRRNNPGEFLDFKKQLRNFPNENPRGQSMMTIHFESVLFTPWNFYGFKTAFFAFTDLGYLYNKKGELFPGTGLYSSIGLGIRLRNPSLVFQTLEFRLAYIPRLETGQQHWYPDFLSDSPDLFLNLHHAKPVVPAYGH